MDEIIEDSNEHEELNEHGDITGRDTLVTNVFS